MRILLYNELNPKQIPGFAKLVKYLEADDFKSAEVKKSRQSVPGPAESKRPAVVCGLPASASAYALILEFIKNHAYQDSRFLRRAAAIDESKITTLSDAGQIEARRWRI